MWIGLTGLKDFRKVAYCFTVITKMFLHTF